MPRARALVALPLLFIGLYSLLPHKELRFVLYAVPPLNAAAAAAAAKLWRTLPTLDARGSQRRALGVIGRLGAILALQACLGATALFATASYHNYPGARALEALHAMVEPRGGFRPGGHGGAARRPIHVHIGVDAAMSGVSRFLERPPPWRYSKAEGLPEHSYRQFAYALVGPTTELAGFAPVHTQEGFARYRLTPPWIDFQYEPRVRVLRRKAERAGVAAASDDTFHDL